MSYYEDLLAKKGITLSEECRIARSYIRKHTVQGTQRPQSFDSEQPGGRVIARRVRIPKTGRKHLIKQPIQADGRRICSTCHEPKELEQYHRNKNTKDGRDARCKPCKRAFMQRWYRNKQVAA